METAQGYSLLHAACFGNQYETFRIIVDELKKDPNPLTFEHTPLKNAVRYENYAIIEFLITRGAYFTFYDFYNNLFDAKMDD